jgi:membrane protease YdiL (CAAX protease family)
MIQELINAALQVAVALVIALIAWLITLAVIHLRKRPAPSFPVYVGLIAPNRRGMLWALAASLIFTPLTIGLFMLPALRDLASADNTVAGMIRASGLSAETAGVILIVALVKTSLSEEIFFRGLLAKRLIHWLGFAVGNTLHALLFGAVHLLIFVAPGGPAFDPLAAAAFVGVTGAAGWIMAWLNEHVGNGSIAPSWLMHGLGNAVAYPTVAFL